MKDKIFERHDFSHHDLSGEIFENCQFYQCDFSRADLSEARFERCKFIEPLDLEGCHFQYTNMKDASFKQCQMAMCNFEGADCFGIEFRECDLKGANFARARFANQVSHTMYFCSAYITGCNLSYTNFERIIVEKCDLFENRWIGANLQGASFRESDLSRGVFLLMLGHSSDFRALIYAMLNLKD
ncbi:Qnr protein [Vibrio maritimus]|uniref:Qnr protein n=1 Tax=Vibrio maritimus TaxID=990268 RepID=A0A090S184_9VIBR|nr:Qnr protein [Vibrio maritimus]